MSDDAAATGHPVMETLSRHLEGELEGSRAEWVRRHVASCDRCTTEVAVLARLSRQAGETRVEWPSKAAVWSEVERALEPCPRGAGIDAADVPGRIPSTGMAEGRRRHKRWLAPAALLVAAGLAAVIATDREGPLSMGASEDSVDLLLAAPQRLSPAARTAYIEADRELERGVAEIRARIEADPSDARLARLLVRALAMRADLAREGAL